MRKIKKIYKDSGYVIPIYSNNKKAFEMGFNWLFAIMAGGFILFLAIFAAGKMVSFGSVTANTLNAKNFVNILETWEAGLASGVKPPELTFKTDTQLYFTCSSDMDLPFGKQSVSASDKVFNDRYTQEGYDVTIKSKYIFTENMLEGKRFYPFSVGYFMPFKIADLIIFADRNYCFYDSPEQFQKDLEQLQLNNIIFPNKTTECSGVKVCFSQTKNCDITVFTNNKYVLKENKKLYYDGNLIFAAIFSSPEIYQCNIQRLMSKLNQLSSIYIDKIKIIERKNCKSNVENKLYQMAAMSGNFTYSEVIFRNLVKTSEEIDAINNDADPGCKLYKNEEKTQY
jgi:hypothetical protein